MSNKVRTRFAPSPTGFLHVGGLRTALYNYLYAKQNSGDFILRIEDTDRERYVVGAVENLTNTLKWMGLDYDEGPDKEGSYAPYVQSERLSLYKEYAKKLIESGHAYYCFCTAERLDEMRKEQIDAKKAPMYDRKCLKLTEDEIKEKLKNGDPYVIRLKMPDKNIQFEDVIRKRVVFNANDIDDCVLLKSDGYPTYHLANVVDDYLMEITHVIRGEEWLPSTPKHIVLYEAFGWTPPVFAHLPLLLNKDRTKLSKRQNDVAAEDYIKKGFLKEAILNFIAFLGWNPGGEEEIYSIDEMIKEFSLEKVHKAGAVFDLDKLNWFNWQWNRKLFLDDLIKKAKNIDPAAAIEEEKKGHLIFKFKNSSDNNTFVAYKSEKLFDLCQKYISDEWKIDKNYLGRCLLTVEEKILKEPENIKQYLNFYFTDPKIDKNLILNEKMKVDDDIAKKAFIKSKQVLDELENFNDMDKIQEVLLKAVTDLELKNGQVFWPLRAVLTGEQFSPGVFEVAWALGKEETLKRIEKGVLAFS